MKKTTTRNAKKLLVLGRETIKKLEDNELKHVQGGSSCLPPPPALS